MIYFDNAATTPVFEEILDKLSDYYRQYYANPNSIHREGQKARQLIEMSRVEIASVLGCSDEEIFFTSCATESNNTIIFGVTEAYPHKKHILVSPIEHKSVLMPLYKLSGRGYKVEFLKVDKDGVVDLDWLRKSIKEDTLMVIVIHGNNETGVVQDIVNIGKLCKEKDVFFFTDTVQSFLKVDIDISYVDFLSVSGHKINAPKGIGLMYKKKGINIKPLIYGGGQEKGLRSGTENTQLILSLANAVKIWNQNRGFFLEKLSSIRERFEALLSKELPEIVIVSKNAQRLPHISNIIFPGVDAQSLIMALDSEGICVSSGSACSSGTPNPSHVLKALGFSDKDSLSSVRFSFGIFNTEEEVKISVEKIVSIYKDLSVFF